MGLSANALAASFFAMADSDKNNHAMLKKSNRITQCSHARNAPKWSFGAKTESSLVRSSSCPGPGKYGVPSVEQKYNKLPNWGFGSSEQRPSVSKRFDKSATVPGPGSYTPLDPNATTSKFGFGTESRMPKRRTSEGPPPGTYDANKSSLSSRTVSMASRMEGGRAISVPGPGAYSAKIEPTREAAPHFSMGSGVRKEALRDQKFPGPGTYSDTKHTACKRGSPVYSFKSRRRPIKSDSDSAPGPIFAPYSQFG